MALFGGQRDISLFRSVNKELIHRIIDTEVLIYKLNLVATNTNLYDETDDKVYDAPILIPCLATVDDQQWTSEDYGSDTTQTATFAFLRDDLVDLNVHIEIGDTLEYRSRFFEIDGTVENQNFAGKNPDFPYGSNPLNPGLENFGYNVSVICTAHYAPADKYNIIKQRL